MHIPTDYSTEGGYCDGSDDGPQDTTPSAVHAEITFIDSDRACIVFSAVVENTTTNAATTDSIGSPCTTHNIIQDRLPMSHDHEPTQSIPLLLLQNVIMG